MQENPRQHGLFETDGLDGPVRPVRLAGEHLQVPAQAGRLWLALHFPDLPLEVLPGSGARPMAVLDTGGQTVLVCDARAGRLGVQPGLSVSAALAIVPSLWLSQRNPRDELRCLESLAAQALEFTPAVSLEPPDTLLLEIGASLSLFGGAACLAERLLDACTSLGHRTLCAVAPTARAASWFVWAGRPERVLSRAALASCLAVLPLRDLRWPDRLLHGLGQMGVRNLGECVRLPRDGLARRMGTLCLQQLDEACGRIPEVRAWYRPARYFAGQIEMPQDTVDRQMLESGFRQLLDRLCNTLRRNQCGVQSLWISTEYRGRAADRWRIGLLETSQDHVRLQELLKIHLDATSVPAPVTGVSLCAALHELPQDHSGGWFAVRGTESPRFRELLERLRTRLGHESVHPLGLRDDHRPEHAWCPADTPEQGARVPHRSERPVWILPEPRRLATVSRHPLCEGRLRMEAGPERIESGWWDGHDVRRDYYIARNSRGMRLWLFRDLRNGHWYLHGLFG